MKDIFENAVRGFSPSKEEIKKLSAIFQIQDECQHFFTHRENAGVRFFLRCERCGYLKHVSEEEAMKYQRKVTCWWCGKEYFTSLSSWRASGAEPCNMHEELEKEKERTYIEDEEYKLY